jgi:uncharacterized protein involved in exopolysaccharide biosynthesis
MSIETFVRVLLRNWWLVALAVVITTASTAAFVFMQEPVYRASTTVELLPSAELENPNDILNTINALTRRQVINTLARKATSGAMQQEIAEALNVPIAAVQGSNLAAIMIPETNLLEIRAESTNPQFAATVANTAAQRLLGQTLEKVIQMEVMDVAVPPTRAFEPRPQRVITLGFAFGLLLGIAFAMLEYFIQRGRETGVWFGLEGFGSASQPSLAVAEANAASQNQVGGPTQTGANRGRRE